MPHPLCKLNNYHSRSKKMASPFPKLNALLTSLSTSNPKTPTPITKSSKSNPSHLKSGPMAPSPLSVKPSPPQNLGAQKPGPSPKTPTPIPSSLPKPNSPSFPKTKVVRKAHPRLPRLKKGGGGGGRRWWSGGRSKRFLARGRAGQGRQGTELATDGSLTTEHQ